VQVHVKIGVIAQSTNRGLGIQTWEACRHLNPERVLLIRPRPCRVSEHPNRYRDWDTTSVDWPARDVLDDQTVKRWLSGLDVVYTAETLYDWRMPSWGRAGIVCHVNPEMLRPDRAAIPDITWWAATDWRLPLLPSDTRVVPMPVAVDRFTPTTPADGPTRFLHVGGVTAMRDRNGVRIAAAALHHLEQPVHVRFATQDRTIPLGKHTPLHVTVDVHRFETPDYWRLYDDADVLVMPRRYGGLCLPAQEAMAAGLAVIVTDCEPNDTWPGLKIPVDRFDQVDMPGGTVDVAEPSTTALAKLMDRLAAPSSLAVCQKMSRQWARLNSWERLLPVWLDELDRAATRPHRPAGPRVSVLIPFGGDDPQRVRLLDWVTDWWRTNFPDWQVIVGRCEGDWVKARAVETAALQATGDLFVIADADVYCDPQTVRIAAAQALRFGWAKPHGQVHRLDEASTAVLLAGGEEPRRFMEQHHANQGGGITAITRSVWQRVPLDPRFVGWGQEDSAWSLALHLLVGPPGRNDGPLIHLFHQPAQRLTRNAGSRESKNLFIHYRQANHERMTAMAATAREMLDGEGADRAEPVRGAAAAPIV
jgi:glycosyltransferase involved in cell wall biosynthesis